ncbi:RloB family protein [Pontiellaceae bacterium B12227]|nr:RloB family protein [Pontiellaceae bacterium B12227]
MSREKKKGHRTARDYGRPNRFEASAKIILIVTEGKNTEINYFVALRTRLKLAAADIQVIHPEGTDPITLTKDAIKLRSQRKKYDSENPFDEVWVVFDLEKQHDERRTLAKKAREISGAKGIKFIESDPSFELWRLLHETYTAKGFDSGQAVLKELQKKCRSYTKSEIPSPETLNKIPTAVKHAQRLRTDNEKSGRTNPATNVDLLVRSMNGATRKNLQFTLPAKD